MNNVSLLSEIRVDSSADALLNFPFGHHQVYHKSRGHSSKASSSSSCPRHHANRHCGEYTVTCDQRELELTSPGNSTATSSVNDTSELLLPPEPYTSSDCSESSSSSTPSSLDCFCCDHSEREVESSAPASPQPPQPTELISLSPSASSSSSLSPPSPSLEDNCIALRHPRNSSAFWEVRFELNLCKFPKAVSKEEHGKFWNKEF